MLTHDEILAELLKQLDAGYIRQADLARHLKIHPSRVIDIKKGDRRIQPEELTPTAEFLGMISKKETKQIKLQDVARHILQLDGMPEAKASFYAELIEEAALLLQDIQDDSDDEQLEKHAQIAAHAVWNLKQKSKP